MAGKKKTVSKSPEPKETPQDVVDSTGVTVSNPVKANPSAESSKKRKFSMSQRAGVVMPVSRILHHLRKGHHAKIIQRGEKNCTTCLRLSEK